jgi:ABC-type Fe3+/spermidine/putrescine transport system ATPase subunit
VKTVSSTPNSSASVPAADGALLELRNVAKRFGAQDVLRSISLQIASGEFLTLLGESGSGKTTLLRLIAGFEPPTSGEIWMNGSRLDTLPPYRRRVNTVFQQYALFPHFSVEDNVAYGLRASGSPASEIPPRVDAALRMVKMKEYAHARPSRLSGGQQQRVALARALVNRPQLLLLDEPLAALDANLRKQMQTELKSLQRALGITFLFVTHDQEEAMALSDRIALLRDGTLEQVASPREIYAHPATSYTAQFVGQTNLLRGQVLDGIVTVENLSWPASLPNGPASFSLRPDAIHLSSQSPPTPYSVRFRAYINQQIFAGATELLELDLNNQLLRARIPASSALSGDHDFFFEPADAIPVRD